MVKVRSQYGLGLAVRYESEFLKVSTSRVCDATLLPSIIHRCIYVSAICAIHATVRPFVDISVKSWGANSHVDMSLDGDNSQPYQRSDMYKYPASEGFLTLEPHRIHQDVANRC